MKKYMKRISVLALTFFATSLGAMNSDTQSDFLKALSKRRNDIEGWSDLNHAVASDEKNVDNLEGFESKLSKHINAYEGKKLIRYCLCVYTMLSTPSNQLEQEKIQCLLHRASERLEQLKEEGVDLAHLINSSTTWDQLQKNFLKSLEEMVKNGRSERLQNELKARIKPLAKKIEEASSKIVAEDEKGVCSICLDFLQEDEALVYLDCAEKIPHVYHLDCMDLHIGVGPKTKGISLCPLCNKKVTFFNTEDLLEDVDKKRFIVLLGNKAADQSERDFSTVYPQAKPEDNENNNNNDSKVTPLAFRRNGPFHADQRDSLYCEPIVIESHNIGARDLLAALLGRDVKKGLPKDNSADTECDSFEE